MASSKLGQITGTRKIGNQLFYVYGDGHMVDMLEYAKQKQKEKQAAQTSASKAKAASSAKAVTETDPYAEFNAWNQSNQDIKDEYSANSGMLQNEYLDREERYLSMASDAQREASQFNAEQAEIQRNWSESMSATAHQREVADLRAAGLNPVISAYGSGASVGSGAAASSSNQLTSVLGSMAASAINAVTSLANTMETNAVSYAQSGLDFTSKIRGQDLSYQIQQYSADLASKTSLSMNEASIKMQKYVAELQNMTQKDIAKIAADASVSVADIHAAASNYSSDIAYASAIKTAEMNNQTSKEVADMQVNKTFEGIASSGIKAGADALMDYLSGSGAYGVHNYNQSIGQ